MLPPVAGVAGEVDVATPVMFVQGAGEGVHDGWDNRLVDSLRRELGAGYDLHYPRMPGEADPQYARWKAALAEELARLAQGAMLVGHSVGGTILINALAEAPPKRRLRGIFLIAAPFVGAGGWPAGDITPRGKALGAALPKDVPVHLYHGAKDDTVPLSHLDLYAAAIRQAIPHRLSGRNHQLNDDLAEVARDIRALS